MVSSDCRFGICLCVYLIIGSKKIYFIAPIADKKEGIVPKKFPGTISIVDDKENNTLLHPDYRRNNNGSDKNENENFNYFVTRLLAKLNPLRTCFRARKKNELISEIFTVTDEAFVLFVLYNELHCWEGQIEDMNKGIKGRGLVRAKRFCNGASGKKEAWSKDGLNLFYKLVGEVQKRRDDTKKLEEDMRATMAGGTKDACITATHNRKKDNSNINNYLVADIDERKRIDNLMESDW